MLPIASPIVSNTELPIAFVSNTELPIACPLIVYWFSMDRLLIASAPAIIGPSVCWAHAAIVRPGAVSGARSVINHKKTD